ncbi:MAG: SIS domain-containing protein [Spirochaetaceae bacterium]|nr:MAG: SIS domain-containing protein [Spirochaetaceae bacterium]
MGHRDEARRFVESETQFQLGFLVTESSHPLTRDLDLTFTRSTADGVQQLLQVDQDIAKACPAQIESAEFLRLANALQNAATKGRMIAFSGCGSTGRLAVLLESMWRRFWREAATAGVSPPHPDTADRVRGVITGGDRALIRSAESFEDFQEFGREQTRELGLQEEDLFIAISEGGETSSVIGSAHEAVERGCTVFFVYNNPTDLLIERIERSRELITDERVTCIDLTTGPMALSGSTRMQATSAELLFVGAAMERAVYDTLTTEHLRLLGLERKDVGDWCGDLRSVLTALRSDACVRVLAQIVETEASVYQRGRMVSYSADRFLLDVFADVTERTPTFSIPPLKSLSQMSGAPNPWAVAYHRGLRGPDAWRAMLGREPVGLEWTPDTYRRLGAGHLAAIPPPLDKKEIYGYPVGEETVDLYRQSVDLIVRVSTEGCFASTLHGAARLDSEYEAEAGTRSLAFGDATAADSPRTAAPDAWRLPLPLPGSPIDLFHHLAIKLVFNTISTATMARMGRIRGNWMVQVSPTNKKLIDRSIRIIADITGRDYASAAELLFRARAERADAPSLVKDVLDQAQRD